VCAWGMWVGPCRGAWAHLNCRWAHASHRAEHLNSRCCYHAAAAAGDASVLSGATAAGCAGGGRRRGGIRHAEAAADSAHDLDAAAATTDVAAAGGAGGAAADARRGPGRCRGTRDMPRRCSQRSVHVVDAVAVNCAGRGLGASTSRGHLCARAGPSTHVYIRCVRV